MNLLLHDLTEPAFHRLFPTLPHDTVVIAEHQPEPSACIGCFNCWVKTPGTCILPDGYGDYGRLLGACANFWIISRITYGGFSPFVKNVLDRNIGYLLPFFEIRGGEMHHTDRYPDKFRLSVFGYGSGVSDGEKQTFHDLVQANARNYHIEPPLIRIAASPEDLCIGKEMVS